MTILGIKPTTKSMIFEKILQKMSTTSEQLNTILDYLLDKSIVFHVADASDIDPYFTIAQSWELAGWDMAAHYHFFTQEAPYLDYTEKDKTLGQVREKMQTYHLQEPDVERCKKYITNLNSQPLPSIAKIFNTYGATGKA
jgi:hypothetical protein